MPEAEFLRSIAAEEGPVGRRVFADWLEETGDLPRAEFVRVQCDLAAPDLPEERRHALRVRERELLEAHRQEWIKAFGAPLEDVAFRGGVISAARLARWSSGKFLQPKIASRLVTLTELDLSGLGIGDAGLQAFAETADFPALTRLILSENALTDAGVAALAQAKGLPRLQSVYLFQNAVTAHARSLLEGAASFRLADLDLGETAEGHELSAGQADVARRQYIRAHLLPLAAEYYRDYPFLRSAMLCVAQYWNDEASDAVHGCLIVSERFEPTLDGVDWGEPEGDPNLPNTTIKHRFGGGSVVELWDTNWDRNGNAIYHWAAFAPEGGTQESSLSEAYAPAVMLYRHGGYEILPMRRPHLDGIRPEW